jgi:hypothetical protein
MYLEDGRVGLVARAPCRLFDRLPLERGEEALRHRIVPAVARPAHAAGHPLGSQVRAVVVARVLAAGLRVMQHAVPRPRNVRSLGDGRMVVEWTGFDYDLFPIVVSATVGGVTTTKRFVLRRTAATAAVYACGFGRGEAAVITQLRGLALCHDFFDRGGHPIRPGNTMSAGVTLRASSRDPGIAEVTIPIAAPGPIEQVWPRANGSTWIDVQLALPDGRVFRDSIAVRVNFLRYARSGRPPGRFAIR